MATQKLKFYRGTILNPVSDKKCDFLKDGVLVVKDTGKVHDLLSYKEAVAKYKTPAMEDLSGHLIMPALFDMHFHWVQEDVRQMPKDSLLEWLKKYTFPTEKKYARKKYSQKKAKEFFRKLTQVGTLGGACYSSVHEEALDAAMDHVQGDFVIGNVLMNMNSPKRLTHSDDESLALTKRAIKKYGQRHCFTPRFAITTSPRVMKEGSKLADKARCFKQTHLSETPQEIETVLSIYRALPGFEKVKSYTEIYQKTGMLGPRSLMGHGIHLSPAELKTLSETKTSVIHCPTSNAPLEEKGLGSGLFDFRMIEKAGVRWALGSDIGGGPYLSMFDVMRSFVEQNKRQQRKGATFVKALYRSTVASAEILGVGKAKGNLLTGKEANFIVVSGPSLKMGGAEAVLERLIMPLRNKREDYDGLAKRVYYKGELLSGK